MIVDATEADWPLIESIAARSGVFGDEEMDALGAVWEEFAILGAEDSGYTFLVDRVDGSLLGFVCYGPRDLTDGVYDLNYLAVDPAARRRGVGRRLLRACEAEVRQVDARMMLAEVSGSLRHAPVRTLLGVAGYGIEATIKDFYRADDDLHVFVKRF